MDAVKVILSMFLVLFHAGLTHQKPHNGINHKVINNASEATYNSTKAIDKTYTDNNTNEEDFNEIDAFNNETKTIPNASDAFSTDEGLDKIINPLVHETGDMLDRLDKIVNQVDKLTDIVNNIIATIHILKQTQGSVTTETTTEAATPLNTSCVTDFDEIGGCFPRKYCNYSTGAIDLTLYAKAGYQRICKGEDLVCCPIRSQLPMTTEKKKDDDFGSDEDIDF